MEEAVKTGPAPTETPDANARRAAAPPVRQDPPQSGPPDARESDRHVSDDRDDPRIDLDALSAAGAAIPAMPTAHLSDEQMRMVLDVSRMLAVPTDLDPLLCRIAEICCELIGCERASIFLHDPDTDELWTKVALKNIGEIRVPCGAGIVGAAFKGNRLVHVPEPYQDGRFNPDPDRRTGFVTRNLLTAPMAGLDGQPLGIIQAVNKRQCPFHPSDLALIQLLAQQAGVAIQRHRLQLQAMEVVALKHEMDLARKTQQALIPKAPPGVPGVNAVGWTLPASTTGGDCFDLWKLPDGRLGILLMDASGHGLAPALIVSQARTLVRALSEMVDDPHELLARVNARLAEDLEWGQFVTAFLGFLGGDGELRWSSAGHGPLFARRREGEPMMSLEPPVQPLGVVSRWMDGPPPPVRLEATGSLILVTDGIFEATNAAGDQLGVEAMCRCLDANQHESPEMILATLRALVRRWHGKEEPLDDQTIVVVQREGNPPDGAGAGEPARADTIT